MNSGFLVDTVSHMRYGLCIDRMETKMLKTVRTKIGYFETYWYGKKTPYYIVNGGLGIPTRNKYGVGCNGKSQHVGTLPACKKLIERKMKSVENNR